MLKIKMKSAIEFHPQNLRFTEWVWLKGTTVSQLVQPSCSSRVILRYMAQDCIQTVLNISEYQWGRLYSLSGQSVLVLSHPHSKILPRVQVELPVHQFLPIASCPAAWHHPAEPGSTLMISPSDTDRQTLIRSPLGHFLSPSSLKLPS